MPFCKEALTASFEGKNRMMIMLMMMLTVIMIIAVNMCQTSGAVLGSLLYIIMSKPYHNPTRYYVFILQKERLRLRRLISITQVVNNRIRIQTQFTLMAALKRQTGQILGGSDMSVAWPPLGSVPDLSSQADCMASWFLSALLSSIQ